MHGYEHDMHFTDADLILPFYKRRVCRAKLREASKRLERDTKFLETLM